MCKRILALLLAFVLLIGNFPIRSYAATDSAIVFTLTPNVDVAQPGDTITYSLTLQADANISAMQFKLNIPAGLSYVAKSFEFDENLKELLNDEDDNLGNVDWTDKSKMILITTAALEGLNNLTDGVTIGTFDCVVNPGANGSYAVNLDFEVLADENFADYPQSAYTVKSKAVMVDEDVVEDGKILFRIKPDITETKPGDTITYSLKVKTTENISAMQFKLDIPSGLTYVAKSFAFDEDLKDLLNDEDDNLGNVDWTDKSKMVLITTAALDGLNNLANGVIIGTFKCTVNPEAVGTYAVDLAFDVLADGNFEDYPKDAYIVKSTEVAVTNDGPVHSCDDPVKVAGKEATCTEAGWKDYYQCSCEKLYEDEACTIAIEDLDVWKNGAGKLVVPHNPVKRDGQAADCEVDGWKEYYQCSCGKLFEDQAATSEIEDLDAWKKSTGKIEAAHDLVKQSSQAADCEVDGWKEYYQCSVCEKVYEDQNATSEIEDLDAWKKGDGNVAAGHVYSELIPEVPATHTQDALKGGFRAHFRCSRCNCYFDSDKNPTTEEALTIPAPNHDSNKVVPGEAASCEHTGWTDGKACSVCDLVMEPREEIPLAEHTEEAIPAVPPTCTEDGTTAGVKCSVCGNILTPPAVDPATNHKWSEEIQYSWNEDYTVCTATRVCENADHPETVNADEVEKVIVQQANCQQIGKIQYVATFSGDNGWAGEAKSDVIDLEMDHKVHPEEAVESFAYTPATCTEPAKRAGTRCTLCNTVISGGNTTGTALGHRYEAVGSVVVTPVTCTEDGYTTKTCDRGCGHVEVVDYVTAKGHQNAEPVKENEVSATCTTAGSYDEVVYCSVCHTEQNRKTVTVDALNHIPGAIVVENEASANCTEDGHYDNVVYCTREGCKAELSRETVTVNKLGHQEEIVPGKKATCKETGLTDGLKCSVCGVTTKEQTVIDVLEHEVVQYEGREPTCSEPGWEPYEACPNCDYTTYKEIAKLSHTVVPHPAQAPTCTEDGWFYYETCEKCDYTTYTSGTFRGKLGHIVTNVDAKEPTCTEGGWKAYEKCTRYGCTFTTYAELAALGHDEIQHDAQAATCSENGWDAYVTCSRCTYTTYHELAKLGHDEVAHDGRNPTCTEIGWNAYVTCSRCDYSTYVERSALGHNQLPYQGKPATCTEEGYADYVKCSRCDYTTYQKLDALGHNEVKHDAQAPTCLDKGWEAYVTCSRCNFSNQVMINALGHDLTHHDAQEADCENAGWNAHETCSRCIYSTKQEIVAKGHKEVVDRAIAATCETTGLTEGKHCSVCEEVLVEQKVVDALGHTEVMDAAVAPKCEETGLTEGKHCSVCAKILVAQEEVPAIDHKMVDATCTQAAHCENEGCEVTEGEPLGHTEVKDEDRMALCDEPGLTEGSHCSVCGAVLIPQMEIAPLGHDLQHYEAKKATYTGAGWEAYEACNRCAYSTKVEIPALGEPTISDYETFMELLPQLEEIAYNYVLQNPGKDPAALVIKYIRTGVERYNSGSWGIMAGYEDTAFAEYVSKLEDEYNSNLADGEEMLMVSGLKNLKNFTLPNGDVADMGHVFGMMDITYHNNFSLNHMDIGGWLGDTVDLLSLADQFGVSGTVDEMVKDLTDNYLLKHESAFPEKPIEGSFSLTDMQGDLDGYYIMHNLQKMEYNKGTLTSLMSSYFTADLTDVARAEYLLKNRLGSVTLREEVRNAVYNAYTGNKMVKTLEDTREFTSNDLANLKKACCYAVADYLCRLAGDFVDVTDNPYYDVFSSESVTLAPGITQDIKYATSADNKQMVFYIATADVNRSDVDIFANYTNNDPTKYAMSRVLDQANFAQEKYGNPESEHYIENYNVITSVNGAGYNMSTGEPSGVLVMHNGVEYHPIDGQGFFGILKDGTPVIGTAEEYNTIYKGRVRDAIAGFGALVKDGKVIATDNSTRASRTAVGITKTGKVVFMVLDGRQEPFSCGGTMKEIAQIMMEAGCEVAINLDGGGSTTYVAKPAGGTELEVVSRPSDGTSRSVSTSLLMVSTAPSSTAFDHAILETATNYMTVGSSQQVTAEGVSATGNAAQIPEGTTWAVSDGRFGSITEAGVFTAKQNGSVDIYLMSGDKVVGSKTMNIVVPNNVYFTKSKIDAVYGETVELPVKALYDGKNVTIVPSDLVFTLSNEAAGAIDGFYFTGDETSRVKSTKLTVALAANADITASMTIALYNQGEATFNFDMATAGDRQFAWDRKVSNSTTEDNITYNIVDVSKDMVTSYIFAIDMTQIPIPSQLDDLIYMLPGADLEGASAWTFLLQLAQRVSVLTEVRPVVKIDPNFEVDYSEIKLVNEYFNLKEVHLDEETNTLTMVLKWKKQTQAIDPNEANPMCILSGIKVKPKADASWDDKGVLNAVHSGEVGYEIYLRASSLYTFAQKPENQETYGLYPFVNPDDPSEAGAYMGDVYATFTDSYTLVRLLKNGWVNEDGGFAYYVNGVKYKGVQKVDDYYYDFGTDGINVGQNTYSGLFLDAETNTYRCAKNGILQTGWNMINNEWYYFDGNCNAVTGKQTIAGLEFTFDNTGRLTNGVWVHTDQGSMYSYGPAYHYEGWKQIDGKQYYFENHYCYKGWHPVNESNSHRDEWYDFGEDGAMIERLHYTGLLEWNGNLYYLVDGVSQYGLQYVDGYYYYFKTGYVAVKGDYYVTQGNGLLPSATYSFGDDYRMKDGIYLEDGVLYYYELGKKTYAGLIKLDGYYYYVNGKCQVVTGSYYVTNTNGLMEADTYQFDKDGRMIIGTGIFNIDGTRYYYEDGQKTAAGLVYVDGYYYYAETNGKVAIGTCNVTKTNNLLPSGTYEFDEKGRMIIDDSGDNEGGTDTPDDPALKNGIVNEDGTLYYYVNGVKTYAGLIKIDGYYYYVNGKCQVVTGNYYVTKNNDLLPSDYYDFDSNGRMITEGGDAGGADTPVDPTLKNGIVEEDGILYYYVNGSKFYAGLMQIDGHYYYVNGKCQVVTGNYYVTKNNGLLPSGYYDFDSNGRMIMEGGDEGGTNTPVDPTVKNGIVNEGGTLYYYVNGVKTYVGLIQIDGYYYYVNGKCQVVTGNYYVTMNNGLLPSDYYDFDSNGRMIMEDGDTGGTDAPVDPTMKNGIVNEDGTLFYYINGVKTYVGLIQIDGYYYYVNGKCQVVTGNYYVTKNNGLLPSGYYDFDSNGRMIMEGGDAGGTDAPVDPTVKNGIVNENGMLYYYINGSKFYAGLVQIDGNYYYVNGKCQVVTGNYYVTKNNGLLPSGYYNFDSNGRMVMDGGNTDGSDNTGNTELKNGIINESGTLYYYVNGVKFYAGLIQIDDDYYYVNGKCQVVTGTYYVTKNNGLMPSANYEFDSNGRMILE